MTKDDLEDIVLGQTEVWHLDGKLLCEKVTGVAYVNGRLRVSFSPEGRSEPQFYTDLSRCYKTKKELIESL